MSPSPGGQGLGAAVDCWLAAAVGCGWLGVVFGAAAGAAAVVVLMVAAEWWVGPVA